MNQLHSKIALVTGAARGIGAAIAKRFAEEGATVIATDLAPPSTPANGAAMALDVAQESEWRACAAYIAGAYGRLDVLVNNAGVEMVRPIGALELSQWRAVMSVNLDGVFLGCRTMAPLMKEAAAKARWGASIVNIASIAGIVGFPHQSAYNVSKAGVRHISKSLAIEFAADAANIRVNAILPGCIRTPMLEEAVAELGKTGAMPTGDAAWTAVASLQPLNRIGEPEDIASAAVFLASDESKFVTGIDLPVDGGWIAR